MSQVTMSDIETLLTDKLKLRDPVFKLEPAGAKVSGSVISSTFRGLTDSDRQRQIWDVLDAEYGAESVHRVGSLLAFTLEEWNIDDD